MEEFSGTALRNLESGSTDISFVAERETATELFVINLCASMTPMTVAKGLPGFEQYKLYQVSRMEDGRRRFRLRLGFFASESAAEIVLNSVRHQYPTAFAACLCDEDRRHAPEGHRKAKPSIATTAAPVAVATTATVPTAPAAPAVTALPVRSTVAGSAPAKVAGPQPSATAAKVATSAPVASPPKMSPPLTTTAAPVKTSPGTAPMQITLSNEPAPPVRDTARDVPPDPRKQTKTHSSAALNQAASKAAGIELANEPAPSAPPATASSAKPSTPFHVAAGIQIPAVNLQLANEPAAVTPQTKTNVAPAKVAHGEAKANRLSLLDQPLPTAAAANPLPMTIRDDMIPVLDSTQTIRTLGPDEMNDANQPKWFAVQLAVSEQPVNLETMPRLDIFAAYCLYSVAVMEEGMIRHALRLGFFKEEVSADAVSGYLKTFFPTPKILRISGAEYKRFADPPPRKPAAPPDNVVKLESRQTGKVTPAPTAVKASALPAAKPAAPSVKSAAKSAPPSVKSAAKSAPPVAKRAPLPPKKPAASHVRTGAHRSLGEQLRDEARQVVLSESGLHKQPPRQSSLLSRLVDKLKN